MFPSSAFHLPPRSPSLALLGPSLLFALSSDLSPLFGLLPLEFFPFFHEGLDFFAHRLLVVCYIYRFVYATVVAVVVIGGILCFFDLLLEISELLLGDGMLGIMQPGMEIFSGYG